MGQHNRAAQAFVNVLAVIETHPVQYHAPVYRYLQQELGVPVTAIYGSDFSVQGYRDAEFGEHFRWDTDLLGGYGSIFLGRAADGGPSSFEDVTAKGLIQALESLSPLAVLVTGYWPRFNAAALLAAWRQGLPVFFRGETTDTAVERGQVKKWLRKAVLRHVYSRCDRFLFIGKHSYNHYRDVGVDERRLIFSPYCVDTETFVLDERQGRELRERSRAELSLSPDKDVLIFSGKLSYRKGPDLLIEAVRSLGSELHSDMAIIFLGEGQLREELRALAAATAPVEVRFMGFRNQTELSQYYWAADAAVLPSRYSETWGLVINEALLHGLPCVVSSRVGCAPDLIEEGETGAVFEAGSVESLAAALKRALGLVGKTATADACRQRVANYSVSRAAAGIAQAYREATNSSAVTAMSK